eukprot:7388989-Prymnesium_polylepis.1
MLHVVPSPEMGGSCCRLAKYSWYAGEPSGWPLGVMEKKPLRTRSRNLRSATRAASSHKPWSTNASAPNHK